MLAPAHPRRTISGESICFDSTSTKEAAPAGDFGNSSPQEPSCRSQTPVCSTPDRNLKNDAKEVFTKNALPAATMPAATLPAATLRDTALPDTLSPASEWNGAFVCAVDACSGLKAIVLFPSDDTWKDGNRSSV